MHAAGTHRRGVAIDSGPRERATLNVEADNLAAGHGEDSLARQAIWVDRV